MLNRQLGPQEDPSTAAAAAAAAALLLLLLLGLSGLRGGVVVLLLPSPFCEKAIKAAVYLIFLLRCTYT